MEYIEVRCPYDLKHSVKGVEYETCGKLLGGIMPKNGAVAIYRCPTCGFSKVTYDNGRMNIVRLDTNQRINFERTWRHVEDGTVQEGL